MNFYEGPIATFYYLVEDKTITDDDYSRIRILLKNLITEVQNTDDIQQIKKLATDILHQEKTFVINSARFQERMRVSFRTIIHKYSKGINPDIVEEIIEEWFKITLTKKERIEHFFKNIYQFEEMDIDDRIKNDVEHILKYLDISYQEFNDMVTKSFKFFDDFEICKKDGNCSLLYNLPRIYHQLSKFLDYNVENFLIFWFNKHSVRKPTAVSKLKTSFNKRLKFINKDELLPIEVTTFLKENSIQIFEAIENENPNKVKQEVEDAISILQNTFVETADREFFAEFYYEIGQHIAYNFSDRLMFLLYKETAELIANKNSLPWE